MRWKTAIWSFALVAVLVALLSWGLCTVDDEATFAIAFVGLLANLVMAGAAAWAFRTWREQLRGEKNHEAATKVLRAVRHCVEALTVASHVGMRDQMANVISEPLFRARVDASLPRIEERLAAAFAEITDAKYEVTIAWGGAQEELSADVGRLVTMVGAMGDALGVFMYERAGNEYRLMESPPFATDWRGMMKGRLEEWDRLKEILQSIVARIEVRLEAFIATRVQARTREVPPLVFPPPPKGSPPPNEAMEEKPSDGGSSDGAS